MWHDKSEPQTKLKSLEHRSKKKYEIFMATFYRNRYFNEIFCLVPLFWDISSRTDVFLKSQFFSKSSLNLVRQFWYQICRGSKNFAYGLMAGKFGKFGLKALFVSCADSPALSLSENQQVRPKYLKP